jgi:hypothetical protein
MLYRPQTQNINSPAVSSYWLARGFYSKSQRAAMAAQVVLGEAELTELQISQIAKLAGVSLPYVHRAMALSPTNRNEMRNGRLRMADILVMPTRRKLEKIIKAAGVARVWDVMAPLIN